MTKKGCCVVPQCRNSSEKTVDPEAIYQKFPTKEKTRRRWIKTIQATFKTFSIDASTTPRLCSDHFDETNFIASKSGKKIFKLDAVPTIFDNSMPKKQEVVVKPRHQSRRAASKEALKQMQILLEDEDDAVEIPDDDDYVFKGELKEEVVPVPVVVAQPKKKYKLTHRKSSDGNDREVLVLKSITPNITNHYVENNLELECWVEELEPCQKERNKKLQEEEEAIQSKLDELIKACKGEVIYKGDLTTVIEVSEHVQKTIQAVQASQNKPPIVLNSTVASPPALTNPPSGYQLIMDPRVGLVVGPVPPGTQTPIKPQGKIQLATNLQTPVTPTAQMTVRGRTARTKKQTPVAQPAPTTPSAPSPTVTTRSLLSNKQGTKRAAPQPSPAAPPATRSRQNEHTPQKIAPAPPVTRSREPASQPVVATPPVTRSREPQPVAVTPPATRSREAVAAVATPPVTRSRDHQTTPAPTAPVTRSRPGAVIANIRPTETNVEGGLTTGTSLKTKAIVDLTSDDGRPLPDSREISFNKLQGKTFPSLVVVARPHLRVTDVNSDRPKLDSKVKAVLMYAPTKFTEWLIQQGLVRSEQKCSIHNMTQLKLGMYSDVSKFPYSGGYVWISECCPQRFVSVFSGSIFEGSPHPPLVILKILYHWSCQTNIQNVTQWVKVDNLYVKGMYTWFRAICTVALQTHIRQLGGPQIKVEVGVISLGTTSQDGNSRQVKVEVLGILETSTKLIRLRAIEPLAEGDRNYKKRFSKILEPLGQWVHPSSIIVTDLTVDKATLHQIGFPTVIQTTSVDANNSNRTIMEYLRRIVPRMFQNTLSLLSRQIIQQFLDELVWREWFGTTSMQAFDNVVAHVAEQTRHECNQSMVVRLNRVAFNPFKNWGIPATSNTVVPPPTPSAPATTTASKAADNSTKKRKRKDLEPQAKTTQLAASELSRPPKSTSPDVPGQMVPLENYYYGTIDNYPPKTNIVLNLKCPFCKEVYNNNIVLMNHLFKHAHNVSKDGQMCRYCLTSVPTANDLLKHIATAHPSETKHDNGFVCLICETQYMNPFVLGKHMSKEHCPSELPYQCGTCGYRCSNHKQAIDHFYKQHDNGPTIQCPFCLKSTTVFSSSRNIAQNMHYFIQHLQRHQRKQYARRCGKCNLWFVQKEILKDHQMKMHASQRGKTGLVPWVAPRNGVMVPKSKMDKYPCDAEGINFATLLCNVPKGLKCKECDGVMDSNKHFPSFESCQNPNCQYSTCCSNAMQEHNAKCNKTSQQNVNIPIERLPCEMFCICGFSSQDGNQMAKHLTVCEKKSAYPSLSDAKSASVTHSMLDVLGLVRKPEEADKKAPAPTPAPSSRRARRSIVTRSEPETITLDEDEPAEISIVKAEKSRKAKEPKADESKAKASEEIEKPRLKRRKTDSPVVIDETESVEEKKEEPPKTRKKKAKEVEIANKKTEEGDVKEKETEAQEQKEDIEIKEKEKEEPEVKDKEKDSTKTDEIESEATEVVEKETDDTEMEEKGEEPEVEEIKNEPDEPEVVELKDDDAEMEEKKDDESERNQIEVREKETQETEFVEMTEGDDDEREEKSEDVLEVDKDKKSDGEVVEKDVEASEFVAIKESDTELEEMKKDGENETEAAEIVEQETDQLSLEKNVEEEKDDDVEIINETDNLESEEVHSAEATENIEDDDNTQSTEDKADDVAETDIPISEIESNPDVSEPSHIETAPLSEESRLGIEDESVPENDEKDVPENTEDNEPEQPVDNIVDELSEPAEDDGIEDKSDAIENQKEQETETLEQPSPLENKDETPCDEDSETALTETPNETFEDISDKDDQTSQICEDASEQTVETDEIADSNVEPKHLETDSAHLAENIEATTDAAADNVETKNLETASDETEETRSEDVRSSNTGGASQSMDYEDISNSGLDTLSAMEAD